MTGKNNGAVLRARLLDWNELRTFANAGIEIGGHSVSHPYLPRLDIQDATREIVESQREIQEQVGCAVKSFAYPYGAISREVEKIVAQYYKAGFGTRLGFAAASSRCAAFERIDAFYLRDPFFSNRSRKDGCQSICKRVSSSATCGTAWLGENEIVGHHSRS